MSLPSFRARFALLVLLVATATMLTPALLTSARAQTVSPKITSIRVERIGALTGPEAPADMKTPDVCGTDIGTMAELAGKVFFAFGDTFGFSGDRCPPGPGGPNWRSNVLAATTDADPSDGIVLESWLAAPNGRAVAVSEGAHHPPFSSPSAEQTRIPTAMVAVGDRLYLHYMSVHGFAPKGGVWLCNYSRFVYSDDQGETWTEARQDFGSHSDRFNMLALSHQAGRGNEDGAYVYAVGTPCGRFGGARVARVPAESLLEPGAWEYYTGEGWSHERNRAVEVILPPVGEGSLLWNPGLERWLYSYLNEYTAALELREAENPWGPWSEPHTLATAAEYPALYGAFMSPAYLSGDGRTLYFIMTQFGPYNAFVMRATLETGD